MGKRFFLVLICLILSSCISFAEPEFNPAILNPAGTINTHDMDTLRRFEQEKQEERDLQKYKENNEHKEKDKLKKEKKIKKRLKKRL